MYYHNLLGHRNDYFFLFDYTVECINKLQEFGELNLIKKHAAYSFQLRGKVLNLGEKPYYIFYVHFMPYKLHHSNLFSIDEANCDFRILLARTALMNKLDGVLTHLKNRKTAIYLYGEYGVETDVVAQYIHRQILGAQNSMLTINCRLMNEKNWNSLVEDEASPLNGLDYSIYFKDIHLLSTEMQIAVDSYLADSAIGKRCLLLSSSSVQIEKLIESGAFLETLYQKFSSLRLQIPRVNEYPEEIPSLAQIYIKNFNESLGREIIGFDTAAMNALKVQNFRYNLHQLEQAIKQLMLSCNGFYISEADVLRAFHDSEEENFTPPSCIDCSKTLEEIEADIIRQVLVEENMNQSRAAKRLGLSRSTLWRKLK